MGRKITDIELEEKLRGIKIPGPDEANKEAAILAAADEFESSFTGMPSKETKETKGTEEVARHKGGREMMSLTHLFKGGTIMTRKTLATLSAAAIAVVLTVAVVNLYVTKDAAKFTAPVVTMPSEPVESANAGATDDISKKEDAESSVAIKRARSVEKRVAEKKEAAATALIAAELKTKSAAEPATGPIPVVEEELDVAAPSISPSISIEAMKPSLMAKSGAESFRIERNVSGASGIAVLGDYDAAAPGMAEYSGRDRFASYEQNPVKVTTDAPVSTFSVDVDTASYAFMRRALMGGHLPQKDSVRIEELINYFDYDYKVPDKKDRPFEPTVAIYRTPWNENTRLLHIGIKAHEVTSRPRANLVFLLDVSGSMSSPDKLPLLKNSLKMMVGELDPDDTVAIVVYAGAAGTVLEPTKVKDKGRIIAALDRLNSGGSTAGGAGIRLAYSLAEANFDKGAVNRIILATDGDFNVGIRDPDELKGFVERKRATGIFLSVLGFGQGNYNDELMQKLAQNGNGNASYIDTLSEARKVLVDEATSTLFTIARDVKIQVEFNPSRVAEYRLIGYESRMLKREDFTNDKVDAGEIGSGHTVTAIYEITLVGSEAARVDPLRYGVISDKEKKVKADSSSEYAFVKIRYKLPGEMESRLITKPVNSTVEYESVEEVPAEMRFAASVAAFGEILKGGVYTGHFSYADAISLATGARGDDRFGYRTEFINLLRLAGTAAVMGEK